MSERHEQLTDEVAPSSDSDRLDSWKEIAAFLRRDVRTVQRWEKQAGLPVHRHAESRLRTAYAYRSELEEWWRAQREAVEEAADDEPQVTEPTSSRVRTRTVAAALLGGLALVAILLAWSRPWDGQPPAPTTPIAVVVARLESDVIDETLAARLQEQIAQQLELHPGIETVAPSRTARLLRLMRREPSTAVTEAIGREIAVRDGRVSYVITGRILSVNSRLVSNVTAVDPADGRVRLSVEWDDATPDQLLARVKPRAREIAALLISQSPSPIDPAAWLEPVTTSSLAALRLYTEAVEAGRRRQWGAAEMLARRAIAADERFASAWAWIGWSMSQQGRPLAEALPLLERARAFAPEISDRESYFISGAYRTLSGDLAGSVAAFEALVRVQPASPDAVDWLVDAYTRAGRTKEAVELSVGRAEQAREDFFATVRAAHALAVTRRDTKRAMTFVDQARKLAPAAASADRPFWSAWLTVFPVFQHWLAGDRRAGLDMLAPVERTLADRLGRDRDAHAAAVGFAHLAFGRRPQAEQAFRYAATPARQFSLAMMALVEGDESTARRWLSQVTEHKSARPALFAHAGLDGDAIRGLEMLPVDVRSPGVAAVTRGLIALRRAQLDTASAELRRGMDLLRFSGEPEYFFAAEALSRIAGTRGDRERRIRVLTEAVAEPAHTYAPSQWTGAYWIKLNTELERIYRQAGLHDDADRIHDRLRGRLEGELAQDPPARRDDVKRILPASAPR